MELDKRIKEGKRPLTCFDIEEAKQYINKRCYFANADAAFSNLDNVAWLREGILTGVFEESEYPFCSHGVHSLIESRQIVPCEWVEEEKKEPKYRPFKDHAEYKEYLNDGIIESWIQIREKLTGEVSELMYVGGSGAIICLGAYSFDLNKLFYDFESFNENTGEWQPFGVLEE